MSEPIKRYGYKSMLQPFIEHESGEYVLYSDHAAVVKERNELREKLAAEIADHWNTFVSLQDAGANLVNMKEKVACAEKRIERYKEDAEERSKALAAAEARAEVAEVKLRYYETELCFEGLIQLHSGPATKAINAEKVSDVLNERNCLRAELERLKGEK